MTKPFWVYMLRCGDGSFYVGHTDELEKRIWEHEMGAFCSWTKNRRPVELVYNAQFVTRDEAKQAEKQIKGWNRAKKQALIDGDFELISKLSSRGAHGRALRDALLRTS